MAQTFRFLCTLLLLRTICVKTTASTETITSTTTIPTPNTTAEIGTPNTTAEIGTPNTTAEIGTPNTTAEIGTPNTTAEIGTPNTTATTATPITPTATATPITPTATGTGTTLPPDPCSSNPCRGEARCEPRYLTYECLCLPGDYFKNKTCVRAKVFPNELSFFTNLSDGLNDPKSEGFKNLSDQVRFDMKQAFLKDDSYRDSTVLKFQLVSRGSRETTKVNATVHVIFDRSSSIKSSAVLENIKTYIKNCTKCTLKGATIESRSLCSDKPCDDKTTNCEEKDGSYNCLCKDGYINTTFADRLCIACPSGQKAFNNMCIDCPEGYFGFNCDEFRSTDGTDWKQVLIIVGSVLGGLLLIMLIVLVTVAVRSKKHPKASTSDVGKPYMSQFSAKSPMLNSGAGINRPANGANAAQAAPGMPRIPRATANKGWDNGGNLEMTPSNSQQNLIPNARNSRHYGDHNNAVSHGQSRPQNNPYAQNRPQGNPYAAQGRDNPYYKYDSR